MRKATEPGWPASNQVGPHRNRGRMTVRPIRHTSGRVGACHAPQQEAPTPVHAAYRQSPVDQLTIGHSPRHDHATVARATRDTNPANRPSVAPTQADYTRACDPGQTRVRCRAASSC